ncbi:DMT family transporter [Xenorhabdus bovienii]|uniref:DMT family transporter n=1 Tax=Xenorhabdus bovienii TaxID=40576 RepID=A0AAJ1J9V6_XENBV|nr:DMT family transporter [Xenorhabdus bovienii]MDE1478792.1 DMT family transporter [Xenorhabdus bovienii]MDE1486798.1 DMT family transporter [Xenorhabdus bovienii]MDE1491032.1 DMT family transporter [Xenorhabdus bovienii]MDE1494455.1 DMT family transporter [Xenorhabdus bovienii]MDE9471881.1 DMT family transporter [Xenorhabdus bovienii]
MAKYKYIIYAFSCVLIWSFVPSISRLGQKGMDHFQYLFWSNILSVLAVFFVAILMGRNLKQLLFIPFPVMLKVLILGALDCFFYLLLYYGYSIENGVAVLVVQYSWPLMIIGLSFFLLKEKLSIRQMIGITLGFIAVLITFTQGNITQIAVEHPQALLLVFSGAFCFALMSVLSKHFAIDPYISTFWVFACSTLVSAVFLLAFSSFNWPVGDSLMPTLLNGIILNGVSYIIWFKAMNSPDSPKIASILFLSPVLSMIWLILFFGDAFVPAYVVGLALVIISGLLCISVKTETATQNKLSDDLIED